MPASLSGKKKSIRICFINSLFCAIAVQFVIFIFIQLSNIDWKTLFEGFCYSMDQGFANLWLSTVPWPRRDLRLQTSDFRLQTSDFGLRTSDFGLQTSDFGLQTLDFRLQTSNFRLQTSDFGNVILSVWVCTLYTSNDNRELNYILRDYFLFRDIVISRFWPFRLKISGLMNLQISDFRFLSSLQLITILLYYCI